jgi:hypothetical protein
LLEQPSAQQASLNPINKRWLWFLLRVCKLPFGSALSYGYAERSCPLKFAWRWAVREE